MRSNILSGHACPFCGTVATRILDSYELKAIRDANQAQEGLAAFQCGSAHIFFVAVEKRRPASQIPRSMGQAAGSGS